MNPPFMIIYTPSAYFVDFAAYRVVGDSDGRPVFARKDTVSALHDPIIGDPDENCEVFAAGFVRSDGCINYHFPSTEDCMAHGCEREDVAAVGAMLLAVYDHCVTHLATS